MLNELVSAILEKAVGSTLLDDVGGRFYFEQAPSMEYPCVVFSIISSTQDKTFTEHYSDTLIQFDIFVQKSAGAEMAGTIYGDLQDLYDECNLTMTNNTLVWMRENLLTTSEEETETPLPDGTTGIIHWAVDFDVKTSLN